MSRKLTSVYAPQDPDLTVGTTRQEAQRAAASHLVKEESKEDPRERMIIALGKDPNVLPPPDLVREMTGLWGSGRRLERKEKCVLFALQYLFGLAASNEGARNRILAARTGMAASAAQYLAGKWEDALRPKTWMDHLTVQQQEEWARDKREYTNNILKSQGEVQRARAAYDRVLQSQRLYQMAQREELYSKLRKWGVKMDEVIPRPIQPEEQLEAELESLGLESGTDFLLRPGPSSTDPGAVSI